MSNLEECDIAEVMDIKSVDDLFNEWKQLIFELSCKEMAMDRAKDEYQALGEKIIESTDFKALYGKNNSEIRKSHVRNELSDLFDEIKDLEYSIAFIIRRIAYIKELVKWKTAMRSGK